MHAAVAPGAPERVAAAPGAPVRLAAPPPQGYPVLASSPAVAPAPTAVAMASRPASAVGLAGRPATATAPSVTAVAPQSMPAGGAGSAGVVLCLGDSLTRGIKETGFSYPSELEALLRDAGHDLRVVNAGNWGDTCGNASARLGQAVQMSRFRQLPVIRMPVVCLIVVGCLSACSLLACSFAYLLGCLVVVHDMFSSGIVLFGAGKCARVRLAERCEF